MKKTGIEATHELGFAWSESGSENDTDSSEYSFAVVTTLRTRHKAAQKFTNVLKLDHSILLLPSVKISFYFIAARLRMTSNSKNK